LEEDALDKNEKGSLLFFGGLELLLSLPIAELPKVFQVLDTEELSDLAVAALSLDNLLLDVLLSSSVFFLIKEVKSEFPVLTFGDFDGNVNEILVVEIFSIDSFEIASLVVVGEDAFNENENENGLLLFCGGLALNAGIDLTSCIAESFIFAVAATLGVDGFSPKVNRLGRAALLLFLFVVSCPTLTEGIADDGMDEKFNALPKLNAGFDLTPSDAVELSGVEGGLVNADDLMSLLILLIPTSPFVQELEAGSVVL
jgi:hypothetical protein